MNGERMTEEREVYLIFYKQSGMQGLAQQLAAPFNINPVSQPQGTAVVATPSGVLSYVKPDTTIQRVLKISRNTGKVTQMQIVFKDGTLKLETIPEVASYDDTEERQRGIATAKLPAKPERPSDYENV